jgi:hypothetical protein
MGTHSAFAGHARGASMKADRWYERTKGADMVRSTRWFSRALTAGVGLLLTSFAASGQTRDAGERFVATAVNLGQPGPTGPLTVEMVVNRWSTDAERDRLVAVLLEKGPDALLRVLQEMPSTGYIRTPDTLAYDLRFARKAPLADGGERIFLATDRYVGFWEASTRPRTIDYPFTYIEMRLGPDGRGEGKMSIFTKVIVDKEENAIVLENYGTQPVLLQNVRRESRP